MTTAETGHFHQLPEQYRFALVDANGEPTEQCRNHLRAISMGFHYAAPDEDGYAQYAKDSAGARLREVREVEPSGELPGLPIATLTSYDQTVNTGHGHLK
ncbi:MAG: GNAT family N-acetyltransferase, partial [Cutibacterium granulosum]|nr:GNAT family N-acetyltransferase [Cutibacterium granulosum]